MDELFDISGKRALVTGGSRGIGLMVATGLLRAGARVIISSRKREELEDSYSASKAEPNADVLTRKLSASPFQNRASRRRPTTCCASARGR